jgi:YD repeat-containing protein
MIRQNAPKAFIGGPGPGPCCMAAGSLQWMILIFALTLFLFGHECLDVSAETVNYTYDFNGRLLTASDGAGSVSTFTYDKAGNILTVVSTSQNNTLQVFISPAGTGSVSGAGIACPGVCRKQYTGTQSLQLTASAASGYEFIGWGNGMSSTANPLTFDLSSDLYLTAYFKAVNGQTDTDGVADGSEMGPNGDNMLYDGNGDGIPDYQQANAASLASSTGGYATISVPQGFTLADVRAVDTFPEDPPPAGLVFPFGLFSFTVKGLSAGACTTVTMDLPLNQAIDHYYKYGPTPDNTGSHWYSFTPSGQTGAQIAFSETRTRISLAFCDAQRGDNNLSADGQIMDLGGPTQPVVYTVNSTSGGNGSITPAVRYVNHGLTTTFSLSPSSGYKISSVTGCGGTLSTSTYTTGPITANCTVTAAFAPQVGSLTVNITPQSAINAGAKWRRTGMGTWLNSGVTENDLVVGTYTVEFSNVTGLIKPPNQTAVISNAQTTTKTGVYVSQSILCEALDNCTLTWTTGGAANWFGQTTAPYFGVSAAQSGDIDDSQESWLQTTVTGPGTLSFYWKVSSEPGYDYLEFYIDGTRQATRISGTVDWTLQSYSIPAGQHTLKWRYMKDSSVSRNSDCGWLDKVVWPPTETPIIQVTHSTLNFGYVPPGSYKDLILVVKNIGGGILTGTVSVCPSFSIISGGNYSLGAGQSQQVIVRYTAPLQEGTQTCSLVFTGGTGITVQVKGSNKNVGLPWLLLLLGN